MSKKQRSRKTLLVNTFGGLGYISCLTLWGWTGILYVPMLLKNESVERLLLPTTSGSEAIEPITTPGEFSPITIFFALAITAAVLIMTVIVILRAPATITKTGKSVTTKAANTALPLIARGKPLPAAKKKLFTANLVKVAKLLLILLPVALLGVGFFIELPLPFEIAALISSVLAFLAIAWFSLQYLLARWLRVKPELLV